MKTNILKNAALIVLITIATVLMVAESESLTVLFWTKVIGLLTVYAAYKVAAINNAKP